MTLLGVEVLQPCEEWGTDPEGNKHCSQYSHNIIAKFKAKCSILIIMKWVVKNILIELHLGFRFCWKICIEFLLFFGKRLGIVAQCVIALSQAACFSFSGLWLFYFLNMSLTFFFKPFMKNLSQPNLKSD